MEAVYGIIKYEMPDKGARYYSEQAIDVLQAIEAAVPASLPIFLSSSTVLTLSGVRAHDSYNELYDYLTANERQVLKEVLANKGIALMHLDGALTKRHWLAYDFDLMHLAAFRSLWDCYVFPRQADPQEVVRMDLPMDEAHCFAWAYVLENELARSMESGALPKAWLNSMAAPVHLRSGMLFGYPAKAIEASLWEDSYVEVDIESRDADIAYADKYFAAWPVYTYKASHVDDPQIVAHQKLWSEILKTVYESDWHKKAQETITFKRALKYIAAKDDPNTYGEITPDKY